MPAINQDEMLSHLLEHLPDQNSLSNSQLESIISNVITNHIEEDDEEYYSEALCKSLKVAGLMNNSKYLVDDSALVEEKVGGVQYKYSQVNQINTWKRFLQDLPNLCPYLPKGGYNLPQTLGIQVVKGEEVKITTCCDTNKLKL